ncbi:MAG: DUF4956 domain-containing protein [Lachnospiraceae bacterium]|nr:DUF4956 domain-containing protein [Lachnospiraceae bacterium]
MMFVKDIIKESVWDSVSAGEDLTLESIIFILAIALGIGLYIYMIYRFSSKSAFYSKDLNITIAGMPIVVSAIMIAMQTNLIVSLGMVGALSIIRFRNAVKNPLDLLFLFWSMSAGIIAGVGLPTLALVLCAVMTVMILVLDRLPNYRGTSVLVIRADSEAMSGEELRKQIGQYAKHVKQKAVSHKNNETEYIFELVCRQED